MEQQGSRRQRNEGEDIEQEDGWSWVKAHDLGSFAYQLVHCALSHVVADEWLWEMVPMMLTLTMSLRSDSLLVSSPTLSSYPSPERQQRLRRQRQRQRGVQTGSPLTPPLGKTSCHRTASRCPPRSRERHSTLGYREEVTRDDQTRLEWTGVLVGNKKEQVSPGGLTSLGFEVAPRTWETDLIALAQKSAQRPRKRAKARGTDAGGVLGLRQMPCRESVGSDHCKVEVGVWPGKWAVVASGHALDLGSDPGTRPAAVVAKTSSEM